MNCDTTMVMMFKRFTFVALLVLIIALTGCVESLAGMHPKECNVYCENPNHIFSESPDGSIAFNLENNYISYAAYMAETSHLPASRCGYVRYYGIPTEETGIDDLPVLGSDVNLEMDACFNDPEWSFSFLSDVDSDMPRQEANNGFITFSESNGIFTGTYTHSVYEPCRQKGITLSRGFDAPPADATKESVFLLCDMGAGNTENVNPGIDQYKGSDSTGIGSGGWGDYDAAAIEAFVMPQTFRDILIDIDN